MKLILTEKPSVARDIAKALGIKEQAKDHIKAGDYVIVWALGHLLEIDDGVAPKKWELDTLPIFPERFYYKAKNNHFFTLQKFIKSAEEVVVATDAGREGELIARLILLNSGWRKWHKTYRLWTSSALTPSVVLNSLKNLRPAKDFDSLYFSALARQHADWVVGINLTRLVSLLAKNGLWSVGRVQTPTLTLVVKRTLERENFKPQEYHIIKATFSKEGISYEGTLLLRDIPKHVEGNEEEVSSRLSKEKAEQIVRELEGLSTGKVQKVERERKREKPPKLYSLTALQRRANELYGWSASKTLTVAQRLYEELKCISYPRTDAEYLSEENKSLVKEVMKRLGLNHLIGKVELVGKRVFDGSKLTDHHAIIPLDRLPPKAGEEDKKLYDLIVRRFQSVFMDDFVYDVVKVVTVLGDYRFLSVGRKVVDVGWRAVEGMEGKTLDLGFLSEGDVVRKEGVKALKRFTQPPPAYTEGSLLKEMERLGLGTPATRSGIIDTLKERSYVALVKKSLVATEKGKALIAFLEGSRVAEPEMTGEWEKRLERIYTGKEGEDGYGRFLEDIKAFVREQVKELLNKGHLNVKIERRKKHGSAGGSGRRS